MTILEGNIGCGKTTAAKALGRLLGGDTRTLLEPDEKAVGSQGPGNPYLPLYYGGGSTDPEVVQAAMKRWSFPMQIHLLLRRAAIQRLAQDHVVAGCGHALSDRSASGDTVFADVQIKNGFMTPDEAATYEFAFRSVMASILHPNICIMFHADPTTLQRRIARRAEVELGRACEHVIPTSYLEALEHGYDRLGVRLRESGVFVRDVEWNADLDMDAREEAYRSLANLIAHYEPRSRWDYTHGRMA
jgi:deoxyadenosine/deoxycytidine kinase